MSAASGSIQPEVIVFWSDVGRVFPALLAPPYMLELDLRGYTQVGQQGLFLQQSTTATGVWFEQNLGSVMLKPRVVDQDSPYTTAWVTSGGAWRDGTRPGSASTYAEQVSAANGVSWTAETLSATAWNIMSPEPTTGPTGCARGQVFTLFRGAAPRDSSHGPASNYTYIEFPFNTSAPGGSPNSQSNIATRFRVRMEYGKKWTLEVTQNGNQADGLVTWQEIGTLPDTVEAGKARQQANLSMTLVALVYDQTLLLWAGRDLDEPGFSYDVSGLATIAGDSTPAVPALQTGTVRVSAMNGLGGLGVGVLAFEPQGVFSTFGVQTPPGRGTPILLVQPGTAAVNVTDKIPNPVTAPYIQLDYVQVDKNDPADYSVQATMGAPAGLGLPANLSGMAILSPFCRSIGMKWPGVQPARVGRGPIQMTPGAGRLQWIREEQHFDLVDLEVTWKTMLRFQNRDQSLWGVGYDVLNQTGVFKPAAGARALQYVLGYSASTDAFLGPTPYRVGRANLSKGLMRDGDRWDVTIEVCDGRDQLVRHPEFQMPIFSEWCMFAAVRALCQYAEMSDLELEPNLQSGDQHQDGPNPACVTQGGHPKMPAGYQAFPLGMSIWACIKEIQRLARAVIGFDLYSGVFFFRLFNWQQNVRRAAVARLYQYASGANPLVFKVLPDLDPGSGGQMLNNLLGRVERNISLHEAVNEVIGVGWDFRSGQFLTSLWRNQGSISNDPTEPNFLGFRATLWDVWSAYGEQGFLDNQVQQEGSIFSQPWDTLSWSSPLRPDVSVGNVALIEDLRTVSASYVRLDGSTLIYPVPYFVTDAIHECTTMPDGAPGFHGRSNYAGFWAQVLPEPI